MALPIGATNTYIENLEKKSFGMGFLKNLENNFENFTWDDETRTKFLRALLGAVGNLHTEGMLFWKSHTLTEQCRETLRLLYQFLLCDAELLYAFGNLNTHDLATMSLGTHLVGESKDTALELVKLVIDTFPKFANYVAWVESSEGRALITVYLQRHCVKKRGRDEGESPSKQPTTKRKQEEAASSSSSSAVVVAAGVTDVVVALPASARPAFTKENAITHLCHSVWVCDTPLLHLFVRPEEVDGTFKGELCYEDKKSLAVTVTVGSQGEVCVCAIAADGPKWVCAMRSEDGSGACVLSGNFYATASDNTLTPAKWRLLRVPKSVTAAQKRFFSSLCTDASRSSVCRVRTTEELEEDIRWCLRCFADAALLSIPNHQPLWLLIQNRLASSSSICELIQKSPRSCDYINAEGETVLLRYLKSGLTSHPHAVSELSGSKTDMDEDKAKEQPDTEESEEEEEEVEEEDSDSEEEDSDLPINDGTHDWSVLASLIKAFPLALEMSPEVLYYACKLQPLPTEIVVAMVKTKPSLCAVSPEGYFPLHALCANPTVTSKALSTVLAGHLPAAKAPKALLLLCSNKSACDVDITALLQTNPKGAQDVDERGRSPLFHVCRRADLSDTTIASVLDANLNAAASLDTKGNYPIHMLCGRKTPFARSLLEKLAKASPEAAKAKNLVGETPTDIASKFSKERGQAVKDLTSSCSVM